MVKTHDNGSTSGPRLWVGKYFGSKRSIFSPTIRSQAKNRNVSFSHKAWHGLNDFFLTLEQKNHFVQWREKKKSNEAEWSLWVPFFFIFFLATLPVFVSRFKASLMPCWLLKSTGWLAALLNDASRARETLHLIASVTVNCLESFKTRAEYILIREIRRGGR